MATTGKMLYISVNQLEGNFGGSKVKDLARESEYNFLHKVVDIAYEAAWNTKIKAVFISGPTSSGKTTLATRLGSAIHLFGRKTVHISLDDYYQEKGYIYDETGRPDMESISTLDTELMVENIRDLLDGKEVVLPQFEFANRLRTFPENRKMSLEEDTVLVVEGLHGLSETVIGQLPRENCLGIFICPWASLVGDRILLEPWQIRQLRRITRDFYHRNASPLVTLDYWPVIYKAEKVLFDDYLHRADYFINSVVPYEFFVIAPLAAELLKAEMDRISAGESLISTVNLEGKFADLDQAVKDANRLIDICNNMPKLTIDFVPPMSILNEFIR